MDAGNVQTASQYVNNLLLARGLLRDGNAIDFAAPSKGGHDATMGEIINLVHDLVLRRDRESDHLSSLSQTLQNLRTDASQQSQSIKKLESEKAELQRELSIVKSQARTSKLDAKALEAKNKAYKEDIQRLRTSVGQIRAQCANDVRKRDTEITRLKKHIDVSRTRDSRNGHSGGPGGVTIIDPTTGKAHYPAAILNEKQPSSRSGKSLHDETNESLTLLSAELGDDNEALTGLVQSTIATLRTLQGLPADLATESASASTRQRSGSRQSNAMSAHEPVIHVADAPSISTLTSDLTATITSLQNLLTEPSFVPLEEVEIRDAELLRLRSGWETMEARWREAVGLMNGWRERLGSGNEDLGAVPVISIDDIQRGVQLAEEGLSVAGSPRQRMGVPRRGRKRDSSGSEVSRASINTYNDAVSEVDETSINTYNDAVSEVDETSMLSVESDGRTAGLTTAAVEDLGEETPKLKKLRFAEAMKPAVLVPAPQVLRPKNANTRSPTRKDDQAALRGQSPVDATPTPSRVDAGASAVSRNDLMSPDIWMQPEESSSGTQRTQKDRTAPEDAQQEKDMLSEDAPPEKSVKRNPVPRRVASKRRSSMTPAEIEGLVGARR